MPTPDLFLYNDENLIRQIHTAPYELGYYTLRFYTEQGTPVNRPTVTISQFYLYPSGGTLRDENFNILWYDSRFDTYRGFHPPHRKRSLP